MSCTYIPCRPPEPEPLDDDDNSNNHNISVDDQHPCLLAIKVPL